MKLRLITKEEGWSLTWRGWLLGPGLLLMAGLLGANLGASLLHINQPIAADALIVEGWLPDYALKGASEEFERGHYRYVITTGGPILRGFHVLGGMTYAGLAASTLSQFGVSSNQVKAVPGPMVWRDRGSVHAWAVRNWLKTNDPSVRGINVYSFGFHARRHQRLIQNFMEPEVKVGVIAHPDKTFDQHRWWASSEGVRVVMGEGLACLWMLFGGEKMSVEQVVE